MDSSPNSPAAADRATPRFETVYDDYARVVHGIALAMVGPDDSDDVMQEAFVAVHRGLERVRDREALPGWVREVTRNAARDHLRRRGRQPGRDAIDPDQLIAPARSPDEELPRRVLRAVFELPESYRETLVLRLIEGLSGPQIASRTGLQPDSVRVNLSRGMAMLRPLLQEAGWP